MILYRTSSMLHFYRLSSPTKHFSKFKTSSSFFSSSVLSSSYPPGVHFICLNQSSGRPFKGFSTAATAVADKKGSSSTFFADDAVSWNSLGLSDRLSGALENSGFGRPSIVQASSIAPILSGKDVVIAAETGSGKTHCYLVPLIDKLCAALDGSENTNADEGLAPSHRLSVVLCPNVLLCEQVVRMANGLSGDDGEPLLRVAAVCGRQGWPVDKPDIIVSTPAALLNNIEPKKGRRVDFIRVVKYVVFDEADMLLNGSFQNQVIRLINMLRFDEKQLSQMNKSGAEKLMKKTNDSLPNSDSEDEQYLQNDDTAEREENSESDVDVDVGDLTEETKSGSIQKKDWRRVRKSYERSKQYIFVAATLPFNGKKTAGAVLKHMFPDATWVSGNYLHCHNPRLKEKWIEVTVDTQVDTLINAVKEHFVCGTDISRTMVFANTVEAVEAVAKILETAGIECYRYHKDHSLEERANNLVNFREKGGVFVCTDAAARGIDIPNVSHVIQADFATSAVDFLHRVGRTARAGQYGLVTSLYTESNQDLVDAIRQAGKLGQPVETAFSRKRSFRNKLKKRGSSKVRGTSTVEMVTV
ncbi:hypothetical protein Pint_23066 [Pistacia integerrima]|uniref:Uncharacterized protein n=1 Tax=Pistacia integerrima TaxID=434235 RepID=A0ACC0YP92_9ROSI|nr:hypothetical protein Pint_23066 [Pistacia integerrima]